MDGSPFPPCTLQASWAPCLTAYEHGADGEDLLSVRVGTHVAETHAGEAAEREVECCDVGAAPAGASGRAVHIGHLQPLAQLVQPACQGGRKQGRGGPDFGGVCSLGPQSCPHPRPWVSIDLGEVGSAGRHQFGSAGRHQLSQVGAAQRCAGLGYSCSTKAASSLGSSYGTVCLPSTSPALGQIYSLEGPQVRRQVIACGR